MSEIRVIKDLFSKFDLIRVPDYQRAYLWEEPQIEQFLLCIKGFIDKDINFHMGHFLFEKNKDNNKTGYVIGGQQKLTTINIFLASVFEKIKELNNGKLNPEELNIYENILCKNGKPKFATVDYDDHFFKSRVINRYKGDIKTETHSQKRILEAIKYFDKELKEESIENLRKMLKIIINASCTLDDISVIVPLKSSDKTNPEYIAERKAITKEIVKALKELPEKEQQVLTLYYYEGFTLKEIGKALNVSESKVSKIHTKAIRNLRHSLSQIKKSLL